MTRIRGRNGGIPVLPAGTVAVLALLLALVPVPARAVYQCGPLTDDCTCGAANPYPCCDNGGNCTWFAWSSACCHWDLGLPGWSHAKTWAGYAESHPALEVLNGPAESCIACRIAPQFQGDIWGHVAWITGVGGGQITVEEMACDAYWGMKTKSYAASYFEKYICLAGGVTPDCGDDQCSGGEDCGSCPEDCSCGGFCEGKASGLWCDGNDLVNCQGGAVASETPCPCSCTSMPPGVNDECAACGGDFCEGKASGLWCDGNDLVKCQGGAVASETPCPCGCTSMPPGVNDECAACGGDFCEGKASGLWCDGDDLVKCQGGAVASVTDCPCGCKSNPPGVNDECESCGSGDFCEGKASGLWCDGDDLVNCQGGAVASVTPCPCGCKGNDPGVNDECESCGSGTFCEEHGDGTWCDGETLVQCTGGQQAWYQPCPFGCGPGQDGAAGCLEAPAPDFCDGRPNGSWCDGNVLTHCKAEDVVGSEDCPLGCEPPAAVGPGQCLGPHAEPSEDTLAAPDAGPGADVPTTPEDVPPGGFGDGSLVLEGEPLPGGGGGPSSGCAAAPRAPVLPWLLLALALVLSRPSRSSRGSARLLLVLVLLLPGFPRELGASPSAAKSVLLVNMNPGEPASEAYQRIEETLRRLAPDLVVRAAHFRALSSEGLRRSPPDALILGPQGTPWWEYPRDELDRFAALVREFPGPILGICGGHQFLAMAFGGTVAPISCPAEAVGYKGCEREQGVVAVELSGVDSPLLRGLSSPIRVSESHYEEVKRLPTGFVTLASSPTSAVQAMAHESRPIYGVQFHPERADAAHPDGWTILERFLDLAGLRPPCESTGRPAP